MKQMGRTQIKERANRIIITLQEPKVITKLCMDDPGIGSNGL